jgi:hypothetical protein
MLDNLSLLHFVRAYFAGNDNFGTLSQMVLHHACFYLVVAEFAGNFDL